MLKNNTKYIWNGLKAEKRILAWGILASFLVISLSLFLCETEKGVPFSEITAKEVADAIYGAGYIFLLLYIVIIFAAGNYPYFRDGTYIYEIYFGKNWTSVLSRILCQAGLYVGVFTTEMILAGVLFGNILDLYFWKGLFIIALFLFVISEVMITFIWVTKNIVVSAVTVCLYFLLIGSVLPFKQISGIIAPDLAFYLWSADENSQSVLVAMASLFFYSMASCFILLLAEALNKRERHGIRGRTGSIAVRTEQEVKEPERRRKYRIWGRGRSMAVQVYEGKKNKFVYLSVFAGGIYYLLPMIINYGAEGSKYTLHHILEIYLDGGNSFFAVIAVLLMVYFYSGQIRMDLLQYEISYGISLKKILLSRMFYAPVLCSITLSLISAGIMLIFAAMSGEVIPAYYPIQFVMMLISLLTVSQMAVFFILIVRDVGKGALGALAVYYFFEIGTGLLLSGLEYVFHISLLLIKGMLLWIEVGYTFGMIQEKVHLLQMAVISLVSWGVHFGVFYLILNKKYRMDL